MFLIEARRYRYLLHLKMNKYLGIIRIFSLYTRFLSQFKHSVKTIGSENYFVKMKFSYNNIVQCFKGSAVGAENVQEALNLIKSKVDICDDKINDLKYKLSNFEKTFKKKWFQSNKTRARFDNNNKDWLNKEFEIDEYLAAESSKSSKTPGTSKRGRPTKEFSELSERSKRRVVAEDVNSSTDLTLDKALRITRKKANDERNFCLSKVISHVIRNQKNSNHLLIQLSKKNEPARIEEVAAIFLDTESSVSLYTEYSQHKDNNMPSYPIILEKGLKPCCPEDQYIHVTDTRVKVDLQQLMKHT